MTTSILITGASGLIGSRLTELFLQRGHRIAHLGRSKRAGAVPSFVWDISKGEIDSRALEGVEVIVHLAGAGIADKRWSPERKLEIAQSRTKSSELLFNVLMKSKHNVRAVVSASAIGYYGCGLNDHVQTEESKPGDDYLAKVVVDWEKEVDRIASLGVRVVKIRTGIVLSEKGGALKEMAGAVRWGVGSPLGTGRQIVSWIHLDDLSNIFIRAAEHESMQGPYNGVSPHPVTNLKMTRAIAKQLGRPLWLPPVPYFVLRLVVGEMAYVVVNGSNVSSEKIQKTGFEFQFNDLESALSDLFKVS